MLIYRRVCQGLILKTTGRRIIMRRMLIVEAIVILGIVAVCMAKHQPTSAVHTSTLAPGENCAELQEKLTRHSATIQILETYRRNIKRQLTQHLLSGNDEGRAFGETMEKELDRAVEEFLKILGERTEDLIDETKEEIEQRFSRPR